MSIRATAPLAERRPLGSTELRISPLCLGGNVFGWTADPEASFAVLDAYAEAGGNFIDTADSYSAWVPGHAGGESEAIIGDWLRSRRPEGIVVATKVGKLPGRDGLHPDTIASAVDASLSRLGVDCIDVYYAHRDDPDTPMADYLAAFDAAVRAGKVRHIAASNFSADRLQQALDISAAEGLASFVALQNHYNLMERDEYEQGARDVVLARGLGSLPYYGIARGFLTGKYRDGARIDSPRAPRVEPYLTERGERVLTAVEAVAERHDSSMATVALAWLLAQPSVTAPIASARNVEQLVPLLEVGSLTLSGADLADLDNASA